MRRPIAYPITPRGPCVSTALCSITHVTLRVQRLPVGRLQQSSSSSSRRAIRGRAFPRAATAVLALLAPARAGSDGAGIGASAVWVLGGPELGVANGSGAAAGGRGSSTFCPPRLGVERTLRSDDSRKSWRRLRGHQSSYSNFGFSTVPCERRSRSSRICSCSAERGSLARERARRPR